MRNLGTLLLAFFVSILVAGIVQNQLAVAFKAREEFIAVMMLFMLTAIVTTVVLGIALAVSKSVAGIDWTALALLVIAALTLCGLLAFGALASGTTALNADDLHIAAEIAVPTALMTAIQWWLVRRRSLRMQA